MFVRMCPHAYLTMSSTLKVYVPLLQCFVLMLQLYVLNPTSTSPYGYIDMSLCCTSYVLMSNIMCPHSNKNYSSWFQAYVLVLVIIYLQAT